ncbi:MAG TPA: tetratricopeptide repeat protein [Vicinamibacterales bacterium]|jgi:tetratricopeptide (TPR) repeat protein
MKSTIFLVGVALATATLAAAQRDASQGPGADLIRQAAEQMRGGHEEEAVATARRAVTAAPDSYQAEVALGNMLDFAGHFADARAAFEKAKGLAPDPDTKSRAQRAIGISYGFEGDCSGIVKAEQPEYQRFLHAKDFYNAGEVANELARLCFDAGKLDVAEQWYRTGEETGLKEPGIKPDRGDLWHYRTEHALARLAARRGDTPEAKKHVAAAKALLGRGNMPANQKDFFPYLTGFVALYSGDSQAALADLQQANQNDAYVLGLMAQAYEKLGQKDKAIEYYRKVMASTVHNPTTAGSRPLARKKLAELTR